MTKKVQFESFIEEAILNIRNDRTKTNELLNDLMIYVTKGEDRHKEVGMTLAKYVETLQRSNEQIVKLASLVRKNSDIETDLDELDRDKIFDTLVNSGINSGKSTSKKNK